MMQGHLPNLLSLIRLCLAPLLAWLIASDALYLALVVFIMASTTDWLDGYIARAMNCQSVLGERLDPIADKALIIGTYMAMGFAGYLPLWLVALVIGRDIFLLLSGLVIMLTKISISLKPTFISKINTVAQMLLVTHVLIKEITPQSQWFSYSILNALVILFIYVVAIGTVLSMLGYILSAWQNRYKQAREMP